MKEAQLQPNKFSRHGSAIPAASPIYEGMSARRFLERHMTPQEPDYFFADGLLDLCYSLVREPAELPAAVEMPARRGRKLLIGSAICSPLPVGVVAYTVKWYLGKRRAMVLGGQGL